MFRRVGGLIETLGDPSLYSQKQLRRAARIMMAFSCQRLLLCEPPDLPKE